MNTHMTTHVHEVSTRRYTHDSINDGFDRCEESCTCGAKRTLIREVGQRLPKISGWAVTP